MMFNVKNTVNELIELLTERNIRNESHEFSLGAVIVDIWFEDKFYVVQISPDQLGFSWIKNEDFGWDDRPDIEFSTTDEFINYLKTILVRGFNL